MKSLVTLVLSLSIACSTTKDIYNKGYIFRNVLLSDVIFNVNYVHYINDCKSVYDFYDKKNKHAFTITLDRKNNQYRFFQDLNWSFDIKFDFSEMKEYLEKDIDINSKKEINKMNNCKGRLI